MPGDLDLRRTPVDPAVRTGAEVAVWALASERPHHRWAVIDRGGHALASSIGEPEAWAFPSDSLADLQLEGERGWLSIVVAVDATAVDEADRLAARSVANLDPVTNALNARGLWERLNQIPWSKPSSGDVTIARVAVDDLKALNHRHGHLLGDQVLRSLADRLAAGVRVGDVVARLGGGEFVVLAHGFEAERLRRRLADEIADADLYRRKRASARRRPRR